MSMQSKAVNEILELEREAYRRFQAGDMAWVIKQFAEDVVLLNPGSEMLVGKEHEHKALSEARQVKGLEFSWEPIDAHVSNAGDMAYVYGKGRMKAPDDTVSFERYVTIYVRKGGKWKMVLQMHNAID